MAAGEMLPGFGRAGAVPPLHVVIEQHSVNQSVSWFRPARSDADGYLEPGWGRAGWHCGLTAKEDDKILA